MPEDIKKIKSGVYILCPICGFIPSWISPEKHIEEVHYNERKG
jgi:hypothetical protein